MRRVVLASAAVVSVIAAAGCSSSSTSTTTALSTSSSAATSTSTPTAGPAESSAASQVMEAMQSVQDQAFLGILKIGTFQYGDLIFGTDAQVIGAARKVCADLTSGSAAASVIAGAAENYGGDTTRGRYFAQQAAQTYCSDKAAALGN